MKLEKYEKVANGFAKFFDTDELITILDRKVDNITLNTIKEGLVDKSEMALIEQRMETLLNQLKTLIVFSNEIVQILLPEKLSKRFETEKELNESITKRQNLI